MEFYQLTLTVCLAFIVSVNTQTQNPTSIQIRIVSGTRGTAYSGRIEVRNNSTATWGTICDQGWSNQDATVACNMLGSRWGTAYYRAYYGRGNGPIYMSNVGCVGNETTLASCRYAGWRNTGSCLHSQDAGISCSNTTFGLEGNYYSYTETHGTVWYREASGWKTVCDSLWQDNDAKVLCRSLGYRDGSALCCNKLSHFTRNPYIYPRRSRTMFNCTGTEANLFACPNTQQNTTCPSRGIASAICYTRPRNEINMRFSVSLVNGTSANSGVVQVTNMGLPGKICASNWNTNASNVVCRQLGFSGGIVYGFTTSRLDLPVWMTSVNCTGDETSLQQCVSSVYGAPAYPCSANHVLCYRTAPPTLRLVGGGSNYGRVQITYGGQTGTICDTNWSENDAGVICRQLGFAAGNYLRGSYYGRGSGPVFMDRTYCYGYESSIFSCRNSGWMNANSACSNHTKDASVVCFNEVRLYRGDHSHGIAMVMITTGNGRYWTPICGTGFTNVEAGVVCRELGFQNGRTLPFGSYGRYSSNIGYYGNNITCTGTETSIKNCSTSPGTCSQRSGSGYASVVCYNGTLSTNTSISLAGGVPQVASLTGRVVVTKHGIRGKVCSEYWDDKDAGVACRQLGWRGGVSYQYSTTGLGPYLLSQVRCYGNETSIFSCVIGNETCSTTRYALDAGVLCYRNQPIRVELVGGRAQEGRVEIIYEGVRGTICSSYPNNNTARVVCRQLGFNDGIVSRTFASGSGLIYMSNPFCYGYETSIFQCQNAGWRSGFSTSCQSHNYDLGVKCFGSVKVINGVDNANVSAGIVQFYSSNSWRTVCADGFDNNDAMVVCRELGFRFGIRLPPRAFNFHYASRDTSISNMNCTGTESSISQCGYRIGGCSSSSSYYAAVLCTKTAIGSGFQYNVTIGTTFPSTVQVYNFGIRVAFCSEGFTDKEAQVVCRSKGYRSGVAFGSRYSTYPPRALGVTCNGNETDLNDCSITTQIPSTCSSSFKSAQVYCSNTGINIRLANSGQYGGSGGRVEIQIGGQWGTICDFNYNSGPDARVICRQLGYPDGYARPRNYYGTGTGPIWFYNPHCSGNETAIWNCRYIGFNTTSSFCRRYNYDFGVQCTGSVRLSVNNTYGAVQVLNGSSNYSLVCADNFSDVDAQVVCRDIGYPHGVRVGASAFGYQSYQIGYTHVRCTGAETAFQACPKDTSLTYCPSLKYASVACSDILPSSGYTLTIENTYHGRVKIRHMNISGYICPNGFDNKVATVICREKGFLGGFGYTYFNYYSSWRPSTTMRWLSNIRCDGSETYLSNCEGVRYGDTTNCSYFGDAAVYCYRTSGLQLRLGNKTGSAGRVEFAIDGTWGTMCTLYGGYYGDNNAAAICRMLNYTDGRHLGIGTFGPGTGPIYLSRLYCRGGETSIFQCTSMWRQSYSACASHGLDNAVQCYDNVRLAGSSNVYYGRVEVYTSNQWVPVCDHNFNNAAARVVCKKLGFTDGKAQCCNAVGDIAADNITFTINSCTGFEADLFNCNLGSGTCSTGKYASVYCSYSTITTSALTVRLQYSTRDYGAVYANRYGFWGPICDVGWTSADANVACRSMGYAGGVKFNGRSYSSAPIVVGKFTCVGTETNITQCPFKDLDDNTDLGCNYQTLRYSDTSRPGAGALCYDSGDGGIGVRLVNGSASHGRVEVSYKGEWGRVCRSYSWSDTDAAVVCRQLGYLDGSAITVPRSRGSRIWMNYVRCTGTEKSIFECPLYWNSGYCSSDAGVTCYDSIRLTRGNQFSYGLVEVNINRNWGGVCANGWNSNDVSVSCKQLGYTNGFDLCCGAMGTHNAGIMDNVNCDGSENKLIDCIHNVPHNPYCLTSAAVACYNGTVDTSSFTWRLAEGNNYTGEILVNFMNITGRICTDGWDDKDATVACKSLGFSKGQAYTHFKYSYWAVNGPFWSSNMACTGSETSLAACPKTQLGTVSTCSSSHSAGVLCGDNAGIYYRISGGPDNAGRVEVSVNGRWGSVCRRYFDNNEATVLCKTLGYNVGRADYITQYPNATGPVYEADFRCTGTESTLAQCPHAGWQTSTDSYCSGHRYDAAVTCYGDIKLASGFAPDINQGPVQVWSNNTWHYVCDTNFDDTTAKTVCRNLGFVDGKALCCSAYGTKYIRYSWYGNGAGTLLPNMTMRCDGSQTDPMACLTPGTCSSNYASVICFNSSDVISNSYTFGFDNTSSNSGQVAVTHYGVKGRICSNFWTDTEATVFCKSLHYQNGIAYHHSVQYTYQPILSRGPFWMSSVNCTGSETSLAACSYGNRTSLGNCSTADIASAVCYNGNTGIQYRMVAPDNSTNKNYGRVEMAVGGVWGTVCDRYFDKQEATVFCRQQGYNYGYPLSNAYYGQGSGPMWLTGLQCKGTEENLHQCPHNGFSGEVVSGSSYYWCRSHRYDASVYCVDNLKLNTGFNASMGAVEIYADNHWNAVCAEGFNSNAATVVCRTFGFSFGAHLGGSVFGVTDGHIGISQVACTGREAHFNQCTLTKSTTCNSGKYASVVCSNTQIVDNGFKVRIVQDDPATNTHGFLEAKIHGIWGSVCGTGFTDRAANVACKQLSFEGGVAYTPAVLDPYFTRYQYNVIKEKTPILMADVRCTGSEASLDLCTSTRTSNRSWCDYYAPRAGVLCYQRDSVQYRLAGDPTSALQGRIEMKYDGQWGTICDPWGFSNSAKVACKSLNHVDGMPLSNVRYRVANDQRPVWFHYFRCVGNESTLPTCRNDGFNNSASIYRMWMSNYCRSIGPTSAKCYNTEIKVTNIRIVGGPSNSTGRVEIYLQGPNQWGTICDQSWDAPDANVVCRMLGFAMGKALRHTDAYTAGQGPIWMNSLGCVGNETSIQDCQHNGFADQNCLHSHDVGVECSGVLTSPSTSTQVTTTETSTATITPSRTPSTSSTRVTSTTTSTTSHRTPSTSPTRVTTGGISTTTSTTTYRTPSTSPTRVTSTTTSTTTYRTPSTSPTLAPTGGKSTATITTRGKTPSTSPTRGTSGGPSTANITTDGGTPSASPTGGPSGQPATERATGGRGTSPAAYIVPIICAVLIAAAVVGFLYYRRRNMNKLERQGLVPGRENGLNLTETSLSAEEAPEISGLSNPMYDSSTAHVD